MSLRARSCLLLLGLAGCAASLGTAAGDAGPPDAGGPGVQDLALGAQHHCAVRRDGRVRCTGYNFHGELGDGTTTPHLHDPVTMADLADAVQVVVGTSLTCVRRADGTARCVGANDQGQVGDGSHDERHRPVTVPGLTEVRDLATGRNAACARLGGGPARCWGWRFGTAPVDVPALAGAEEIRFGLSDECARFPDGSVRCGGFTGAVVADGATALSTGYAHACVRRGDGTLRCWGYNNVGQLGDGSTRTSTTPVDPGLREVVEVALGAWHSCARRTDGTVLCWGDNGLGQLGDGTLESRAAPTPVSGITGATRLVAGFSNTCTVHADGAVRCWGWGAFLPGAPPDQVRRPVAVTW